MPLNITAARTSYPNPSGLDTNSFTIEGWFYFDDVTTQQYIVHMHAAGDAGFYTILQVVGGKLQLLVGGAGGPSSTTTIVTKRWYYVVICCSNDLATPTTMKLWIDGVPDTLTVSTVGVGVHAGSICISGRVNDANRRFVRGSAHKVRIYNTTITSDSNILAAYQNPLSNDLASVYSANLVFNAELDANTDAVCANGTQTQTVSGTSATLTDRYPLNIPGLGFFGDLRSASNTITSNKVATLADLSGNSNHAVDVLGSGPAFKNDAIGIGVKTGQFVEGTTSYLQQAASGGMHTSSRKTSVIAWMSADKLGLSVRQTLIQLGDPATNNAGVLDFGIDGAVAGTFYGNGGKLRVGAGGSQVGNLSGYMTSATPRMWGVVSGPSSCTLFNDKLSTAVGAQPTDTTATGFRIGAKTGTLGEPLVASAYMLLVYQRYLSTAEVNALNDWGKTYWLYADPEYILTCEGSSTMDGYGLGNNENITYRLAATLSNFLVYNFSNAAESRTHFDNQYSFQCGDPAALNGFDKAHRLALFQVFGNDWDGTTTLADIQTDAVHNYAAVYTKFLADYSKVLVIYPQPRTSGTGYDDTGDVNRETDVRAFMTWTHGYNSSLVTVPRPSAFVPASLSAVDIQAVAKNLTYYQADETHLNATGIQLLTDGIYGMVYLVLNPPVNLPDGVLVKYKGFYGLSLGFD